MITITISGPQSKGKTAIVRQVATLLQTQGKIVRIYEESKRPAQLPSDADVIIIEEQTPT